MDHVTGLATTTILVGLGAALITFINYNQRRKQQKFARRNFEALGHMRDFFTSLPDGKLTATLFPLKELEKATNGFANEQKLRAGGFGAVYEGTFDSNGLIIAVKKTNHMDTSGSQQFLNEVSVLSQVNHCNLVRLNGCCLETEVPMLVYEYVPNGNLSEHLRGEKSFVHHLDLAKQLQIAIEIADAITYLHSAANPPTYHRDLKPANILLDDTFHVKVSDFGISKLIRPDATHVSTVVQGTPGYLDPDYFHKYQLTDKSDVYSFGVILFELITSLSAIDFNRDPDDINLVSMTIPHIKDGNVKNIMDPKLLLFSNNYEEEKFPIILQQIESVANITTHCLATQRQDQPSMKQASEELHQIKDISSSWNDEGPNMSEFELVNMGEIELVQFLDANAPNLSNCNLCSPTQCSDNAPLSIGR